MENFAEVVFKLLYFVQNDDKGLGKFNIIQKPDEF